ncbi:MAG: VCBS repeat-containing protein [Planctomycetota bacterium]
MKPFSTFAALAAGLTLCAGLSAAQHTFSNSIYATNDAPQGLASGDFNGDGWLDLVVTASNPDRMEVWLNDIDGTYTLNATMLLPVGSDPRHVAVADFNGDLTLDAAVLLYGSNELQTLNGLGGGAFALGPVVATGLNPVDIETADADGDQDMDLLVVTQGDNSVTLFFNDGAGVLTGMTMPVGVSPHGCTFGDFDGDMDWDFAVSNTTAQTISVFENQGQGVLSTWSTIVGNHPFFGIVAGDFDGDQDDDLAIVATDIAVANDVSVFLSDGLGGWGAQTDWHMPVKEPSEIAVGDLDCDGDLDLVVGLLGGFNGGFVVLDNDGSGGFPVPQRQGRGLYVSDILAADLDNDGGVDVANTGRDSNFFAVSLNRTCGLKITRSGHCNQMNDFVFSGATPGGVVFAVIAHDPGSFMIPLSKPCGGTILSLDGASIMLAGLEVADANGEVHVSFWGGSLSCGMWLQIMDADTCNVSNISQLTP